MLARVHRWLGATLPQVFKERWPRGTRAEAHRNGWVEQMQPPISGHFD
ncbi:hypothetical protein PLANPX_5603 [Lacipirellula parvula]|uniref:Uncharacterized protein n=1 Tax=Lacipirellula parvula TaxID=2650471 RepID=A0A5K7XL64_9BACT|nr:hypothetical protein PLANPX_5603 [Lacipirellula parvula]